MKARRWQNPGVKLYLTLLNLCCISNVLGEASLIVIPFDIPVNTLITKLSNIHVKFNKDENLANALFDISKDGELTTKKELLLHIGRCFELELMNESKEDLFIDWLNLRISSSTELKSFTSLSYIGIIQDQSPPGSEVRWNENIKTNFEAVKYTLEPSSKLFEVIVRKSSDSPTDTHDVKIVTTHEISAHHVVEDAYILKAWINDSEFSSTSLKIKINSDDDCIPKFSKKFYHATVHGDTTQSPSESILNVSVIGQSDDRVTYSISNSSIFYIDPRTGLLFLKEFYPGQYLFKVFAQDANRNICHTSVSVLILPVTLKFRPFHQIFKRQTKFMTVEKTYVVLENQTAGTVVFSVASKPPAPPGTEFYSILYDSIKSFQVDTRGNVYLRNGHTLDYENPQHRNVTIRFRITSSLSQGEQDCMRKD